MFPPDLALTTADRALMTAALGTPEAHERAQANLWHQLATVLKAANCPANAANIQTAWHQKIEAINAKTNFGYPGIARLRPR